MMTVTKQQSAKPADNRERTQDLQQGKSREAGLPQGANGSNVGSTNCKTIEYYYDSHPTEEDLMGFSPLQAVFVRYMLPVLDWLFRREGWYNALELNIYLSDDPGEVPTVPDIAVFKGVVLTEEQQDEMKSWRLHPPERPAPSIVFEVASKNTWTVDLDEKPQKYAEMGVREYVYYDPRHRRPRRSPRMRVWRYTDGVGVVLPANERGWVWSEELESWLVPDGRLLRLYDRHGNRRPTGEEAERAEKEAAQAARQRERAENERLRAKLRGLGIDPDALD